MFLFLGMLWAFSLWVLLATIFNKGWLLKDVNLLDTHLDIVPNEWRKIDIYDNDPIIVTIQVIGFFTMYIFSTAVASAVMAMFWPGTVIVLGIAIFIARKQIKHNKLIENERSIKSKESDVRNHDVDSRWYN